MMDDTHLTCRIDGRRERVRSEDLNGLDYLEVCDDGRTLNVYLLGKAPGEIGKENVRIEGGRRVTGLRVVDIEVHREEDPDLDDLIEVVLDREGDFSTYTLSVVEPDDEGGPTGEPMSGFDPRYSRLEFGFKAGCPSDLDCRREEVCPQPEYDEPEIDYLARDYASFRRLILDRLALVMPDWRERHAPDLGVALVEVLAYVGDHLGYYQDAVATEAYLHTARRRVSVRRHARLVDYPLHEGCNARAWVFLHTKGDLTLDPQDMAFVTGDETPDAREELDGQPAPAGRREVFEPLVESGTKLYLYEEHNEILFHTWGGELCCLPRGATAATLKDRWIEQGDGSPESEGSGESSSEDHAPEPGSGGRRRALRLREGDVLIFEEVVGPETGDPADADPARRHAVRLTGVEPGEDPLYDQPIVEIGWSPEDALPFPLCLSTVGPAPACEPVEDVSVARGNVVLADHGETAGPEDLGTVPEAGTNLRCGDGCRPLDIVVRPRRFRPRLMEGPLTFAQGLRAGAPVAGALVQDPRQAAPGVGKLIGTVVAPDGARDELWTVRRDLLPGSGAQDRHFVVEVDDEGRANLRFGDGEAGAMPEAGTAFRAVYRVGNGPSGNVGAGAINRLVFRRNAVSGVEVSPRNPLPARGGTPPESLAEARLLAPYAFQTELQRAITADDYARLAERHPGVQRAAATLRWTGSSYEALVAVDPREGTGDWGGPVPTGASFADAVLRTLERYLDLENFNLSPGGQMAGRVVGVLRGLRAAAERNEPPDRLAGLVREALPGLGGQRDLAVARDYELLGPYLTGLVADLEQAAGMMPERPTAGATEDRLLWEVEEYLRAYRRIGHDVLVARAEYVPLDVAMEVCVKPGSLRAHVKAALLELFGDRTLPDGRRGFFHPDGLSFGDGIFLSRLVATAQAVAGVESVRVTRLQRLFEKPAREIETGVLALGPFEIARLDNDPDFPENGQLRLEMRGGR